MAQDPYGDIPLFREIQRILASSEGPLNLEIARQIATAVATQGSVEPRPGDDVRMAFTRGVREAEVVIAGFTRLPLVEPMRADGITRSGWVGATLRAWKWLFVQLGERMSSQIDTFMPEGEQTADPMQLALGQVAPLLLGIQAGTVVGEVAKETLGRYDLPIPREDDGSLFLVASNAAAVAQDYGFDLSLLVRWLALRDVSRHIVFTAIPWTQNYERSLIVEVIESIEIDASDFGNRLADLQAQGIESLQQGFSMDQMLPVVQSPRHTAAVARLHAFIALVEGYAELAASAVSESLLGDTAKIDEGMTRARRSPTQGQAMMNALLGITSDRELEQTGRTFCAAVNQLRSLSELNRVWEAPDNLPSLAEIKDPFQWMDRVLD